MKGSRLTTRVFSIFIWGLLSSIIFSGCNGDESDPNCPCAEVSSVSVSKIQSGDIAKIQIDPLKEGKEVKSIELFLDNKLITNGKSLPFTYDWNSVDQRIGRRRFVAEIKYADGNKDRLQFYINITSDIVPKKYGFKINSEYPHDQTAYTQGLLIHNGEMYESTGQYGESNIRKVDLVSGKVVFQRSLENNFFGEGIALFDDLFYHLSWRAHKGWVYSKDSFNLVREFNYPVEGWGITSDSSKLLMSDGSNVIYFLDPKTVSKIGSIEVYEKDKAVFNINELEYINGQLFANIWQTDEIVIIDPKTGKVTGRINLTGLYADHDQEDNVLNGIAWDQEQKKLYVTGKRWGKLFEIELVEQD